MVFLLSIHCLKMGGSFLLSHFMPFCLSRSRASSPASVGNGWGRRGFLRRGAYLQRHRTPYLFPRGQTEQSWAPAAGSRSLASATRVPQFWVRIQSLPLSSALSERSTVKHHPLPFYEA